MSANWKYIFWFNHRTDWKKMGNDNGEHSDGHRMASHVLCGRIQRNFARIWSAGHQCWPHGSIGADLHRWSVVSLFLLNHDKETEMFMFRFVVNHRYAVFCPHLLGSHTPSAWCLYLLWAHFYRGEMRHWFASAHLGLRHLPFLLWVKL